jgi:hypothetical protein
MMSVQLEEHQRYPNLELVATCFNPIYLRGRTIRSLSPFDFNCSNEIYCKENVLKYEVEFFFRIEDAPSIVKNPQTVIIESLEIFPSSIRFECEASGDPKPEIKWLKNKYDV